MQKENVGRLVQKVLRGVSLATQCIRIHLPVLGAGVRSLVWEDPTCLRVTQPLCHGAELTLPNKRRPRSEKPHSPRPGKRPHSGRGPAHPNRRKFY